MAARKSFAGASLSRLLLFAHCKDVYIGGLELVKKDQETQKTSKKSKLEG
jgi:hypothetical protein